MQLTVIQQGHAPFRAEYSGRNSLSTASESVLSITSTMFVGARLWRGGEIYFDPELAGGGGISGTRGIAGFPNGEGTQRTVPEQVIECYCAALLVPWFTLTLDDQLVINPAYNRDRGPLVHVHGVRAHVEL